MSSIQRSIDYMLKHGKKKNYDNIIKPKKKQCLGLIKHSQLHFNSDLINEDGLNNFGCLVDISYLLIYLTFFENEKKNIYININFYINLLNYKNYFLLFISMVYKFTALYKLLRYIYIQYM